MLTWPCFSWRMRRSGGDGIRKRGEGSRMVTRGMRLIRGKFRSFMTCSDEWDESTHARKNA